jgi:hypothetical protein
VGKTSAKSREFVLEISSLKLNKKLKQPAVKIKTDKNDWRVLCVSRPDTRYRSFITKHRAALVTLETYSSSVGALSSRV